MKQVYEGYAARAADRSIEVHVEGHSPAQLPEPPEPPAAKPPGTPVPVPTA